MEGGPKQQKKYKQLMLNRVKWSDDTYTDKDGSEHQNKAELVWEVGKGFLLISRNFSSLIRVKLNRGTLVR